MRFNAYAVVILAAVLSGFLVLYVHPPGAVLPLKYHRVVRGRLLAIDERSIRFQASEGAVALDLSPTCHFIVVVPIDLRLLRHRLGSSMALQLDSDRFVRTITLGRHFAESPDLIHGKLMRVAGSRIRVRLTDGSLADYLLRADTWLFQREEVSPRQIRLPSDAFITCRYRPDQRPMAVALVVDAQ